MIVILFGVPFILALMFPVTFRIEVQHGGSTTYRIVMQYALLRKTRQSGGSKPAQSGGQEEPSLLRSLLREAKARQFIRRHIQLETLDALILLHTGDAARTSLLAGGLQGLAAPAAARRNVRIRVLPDFFRGRTTLQARCILRVRMGILLLTMLMLLASRLQRKARTAYGTSHW